MPLLKFRHPVKNVHVAVVDLGPSKTAGSNRERTLLDAEFGGHGQALMAIDKQTPLTGGDRTRMRPICPATLDEPMRVELVVTGDDVRKPRRPKLDLGVDELAQVEVMLSKKPDCPAGYRPQREGQGVGAVQGVSAGARSGSVAIPDADAHMDPVLPWRAIHAREEMLRGHPPPEERIGPFLSKPYSSFPRPRSPVPAGSSALSSLPSPVLLEWWGLVANHAGRRSATACASCPAAEHTRHDALAGFL